MKGIFGEDMSCPIPFKDKNGNQLFVEDKIKIGNEPFIFTIEDYEPDGVLVSYFNKYTTFVEKRYMEIWEFQFCELVK